MTPLPAPRSLVAHRDTTTVSVDTPIGDIEPEDLIWVADKAGVRVGYITAVTLARALRALRPNSAFSLEGLLLSSFEDALDAIVVVDVDGYVIFLNRAYEVILQVRREDAIGQYVGNVIPGSRMHIVAQTGIPEVGRPFLVNGHEYIVERHPIFEAGRVIGAVGRIMFRSIADVKLMVDRLDALQKQVEYYERQMSRDARARYRLEDLVGNGPALTNVKKLALRAARSNSTVLILGESGTGKELLAHALHNESARAGQPFVKVNCAAIPRDLLESELFGYESGAFSGALKGGKPGKFELANRGTIFLDEIADMSLEMQAKVLRAVQEREIQKVGGTREVKVDVRIIAATNKDLVKLTAKGEFRSDLYYRLAVIELQMPPLRERPEDIPLLVRSLMDRVCREAGIEVKALTPAAMEAMQSYAWPGNVRELVHTLERIVNIAEHDVIDWADLPPYVVSNAVPSAVAPTPLGKPSSAIRERLNMTERDLVMKALQATGGNKLRAAEQLGIHRSVLYRKLQRWGIEA